MAVIGERERRMEEGNEGGEEREGKREMEAAEEERQILIDS